MGCLQTKEVYNTEIKALHVYVAHMRMREASVSSEPL